MKKNRKTFTEQEAKEIFATTDWVRSRAKSSCVSSEPLDKDIDFDEFRERWTEYRNGFILALMTGAEGIVEMKIVDNDDCKCNFEGYQTGLTWLAEEGLLNDSE